MEGVNRLLTKDAIDATLNYKFDFLEQVTVFEFTRFWLIEPPVQNSANTFFDTGSFIKSQLIFF